MSENSKGSIPARGETKKLKVLYIYKDFDIYNGLIETFLILSRKNEKLPFDFEVCVFRNEKDEHSKIFLANGGILNNIKARWESSPLIIFKLYKLFRSKRPDVVQTFILKPNIFGIISALLAKVPVVIATDLTMKNQAPTWLRRLRDKFLYKIYVGLANKADHVICVSEAGREELKALGVGVDVSVIPPPIDIDRVKTKHECELNSSLSSQSKITLGIVARLSEEKRHADLFEAFSILSDKYSDINLLIIGDGPLRSRLEALTRRIGIDDNVKFLGFQKDVHKYLCALDIFVLPSRTEGLPISIMEAMACGIPVVASRSGGIPEIVDDQENGLLFDPGNIDQLVSALSQLIENQNIRIDFGERGRKKVNNLFHPGRFIEGHFRLYRSLLGQ